MTRKRAPAADPGGLDPGSLFQALAGRKGLILAVSGGPDSTALMLLMARWRERPPVQVVSVDHGLRPEARNETRLVAENAARLGLPSRSMEAAGPPHGNLQDWARRARYACLAEAARDAGFDTIVTAHHRDDQAETFLLRLARGSGVYGLAAMRGEEPVGALVLARPLLAVPRAVLIAIAADSGLPTVADPSNIDRHFDRARMRALMPDLAGEGLDATRLAETASRMRRAADALDHYAGEFLRTNFTADSCGSVSGRAGELGRLPEEVGLRSLARILQAVGGADYTPPLSSVEALRDAILAAGAAGHVKRTLAGVVVNVAGGRLTAGREWGREGLAEIGAAPGAALVWDGRFRVDVPRLPGVLDVRALGTSPHLTRSASAAPEALRTLPALFQNGTLIAAPAGVLPPKDAAPLDILAAECIVGQRLGLGGDSGRLSR